MKKLMTILNNDRGTVLIAAILILVLLTLLGITGIYTSTIEKSIAVNDQIYKMTFYVAEAGRTYVVANSDLYGPDNITPGSPVSFPLPSPAPAVPAMGSGLSFDGEVEYLEPGNVPPGFPFDTTWEAHFYKATSQGHGPRNAQVAIEVGFFRPQKLE